jgi:putative nucleotidyltransferase with HDIG domain
MEKVMYCFDKLFKLFEVFDDAGLKLYHVGGSVRDMMLGREPKDFDFTTNARPAKTKEILKKAGYKHWPLGEKFGTIAANIDGVDVEITTHRKDMTPGRHPDVVFTNDLKEDLARRDFTINSMAMDSSGKVVDPFNGLKDLGKKLVRATGNPKERFSEDPLRMLRAIRFCSQLNFDMDSETLNAVEEYAQAIMTVSRERWFDEMSKLLLGDVRKGFTLLYSSRLLGYLLPEVYAMTLSDPQAKITSKNLSRHTMLVAAGTPSRLALRWAAILHDIGKPYTRVEGDKEVHFFQHEHLGAEMVEGIARRYRMSNKLRRSIKGLVALHQRVGDVVSRRYDPPVSENALRRLIRDCDDRGCDIDDLIDLFAADCTSTRPHILERHSAHSQLLKEALENIREKDARPRLPKGIGNEIMDRFHLEPGAKVGEIKKKLEELLLEGKISSNMTPEKILNFWVEYSKPKLDKDPKCYLVGKEKP